MNVFRSTHCFVRTEAGEIAWRSAHMPIQDRLILSELKKPCSWSEFMAVSSTHGWDLPSIEAALSRFIGIGWIHLKDKEETSDMDTSSSRPLDDLLSRYGLPEESPSDSLDTEGPGSWSSSTPITPINTPKALRGESDEKPVHSDFPMNPQATPKTAISTVSKGVSEESSESSEERHGGMHEANQPANQPSDKPSDSAETSIETSEKSANKVYNESSIPVSEEGRDHLLAALGITAVRPAPAAVKAKDDPAAPSSWSGKGGLDALLESLGAPVPAKTKADVPAYGLSSSTEKTHEESEVFPPVSHHGSHVDDAHGDSDPKNHARDIHRDQGPISGLSGQTDLERERIRIRAEETARQIARENLRKYKEEKRAREAQERREQEFQKNQDVKQASTSTILGLSARLQAIKERQKTKEG